MQKVNETYTLYGVKAKSIYEAALLAERVLGVKFQARNGLHMGGTISSTAIGRATRA